MDGASASKPSEGAPGTEVTVFVQGLLNQMQSRFDKLSEDIISKIDDMGSRIEELERGISDIIEQAAGDDKDSPAKS